MECQGMPLNLNNSFIPSFDDSVLIRSSQSAKNNSSRRSDLLNLGHSVDRVERLKKSVGFLVLTW